MAALGDFLRSHREASGITLSEISARTRISVTQLGALEAERFELLPGGVFNVSFVRQFARCIRADENEAVERLKVAHDQAAPMPLEQPAFRYSDEYLGAGPVSRLGELLGNLWDEHGGAIASVAVGLLLLVGGVYSFEAWEAERQAAPVEAATTAIERPQPSPAPAAAAPAPVQGAESEALAPIRLELRIVDTVWILAQADGERVFEGIFKPGEKKPIIAEEEVMLRVGNAGGVELALNGHELPSIGPKGHVRRVKVTEYGMKILDPPAPKGEIGAPPTAAQSPSTTAQASWSELASSEEAR